jgi:hypothetical protein
MPAKSDPRESWKTDNYYYRRSLSVREMLPAVGAGIVAGAAVFYLATLLLQRTPLDAKPSGSGKRSLPRPHGG